MKHKRSEARKASLTGSDVEQLAYQTLRDTAKLFPKTREDLEVLESELEGAELPPPNTDRLLRILRGELPPPDPKLPRIHPETIGTVTEGLAIAARKGVTISSEIRARMDADRASAERAVSNACRSQEERI